MFKNFGVHVSLVQCMVKEISPRTEDMEKISDNNYEIQKMESFQYL